MKLESGVGSYWFGFNGKERDTEFQNNYDYGFRIYNPGLAVFLSVDPLTSHFAWWSPYEFAALDPINYIDLEGLQPPTTTSQQSSGRGIAPLLGPPNIQRGRVANPSMGSPTNDVVETATPYGMGWGDDNLTFSGNLEAIIRKRNPSFRFVQRTEPLELKLHTPNYTEPSKNPFVSPLEIKKQRIYKDNFDNLPAWYLREVAEREANGDADGYDKQVLGWANMLDTKNGFTDKTELHHFASNKSNKDPQKSSLTGEMKRIASKYQLNLNGDWNLEAISKTFHNGNHSVDYHQFVLDGMREADRQAGGTVYDTDRFLQLFDEYVKQPVRAKPEMLNPTWTP